MLARIALLCVRPEYWPQAARFPLSATLWPVVLVGVVMSALVSLSAMRSVMQTYNAFAASYDGQFFPMQVSGGKLSRLATTQPAGAPALVAPTFTLRNIPYWSGRLAQMKPTQVIFDPDKNVRLDVVDGQAMIHITDTEMIWTTPGSDFYSDSGDAGVARAPLAPLLAPLLADQDVIINGQTLQHATQKKSEIAIAVFLTTFICHCLSSLLWAFLMGVLMIPVVLFSAARLAMPRHVAFRIGLAVTVPLLVVGGILEATGALAQTSVPADLLPIFWCLCAAGMALWSGILANRIYAPRRRAPKGGT
jgi:hypothetical protein